MRQCAWASVTNDTVGEIPSFSIRDVEVNRASGYAFTSGGKRVDVKLVAQINKPFDGGPYSDPGKHQCYIRSTHFSVVGSGLRP